MGLTGLSKKEKKPFIVKADRESERPTKFIIGNLPTSEKADMMEALVVTHDDGSTSINAKELPRRAIGIVKKGLRRIEDLYDPDKGDYVSIAEITDEAIDSLPFETVIEVAAEILLQNFSAGEVRKN